MPAAIGGRRTIPPRESGMVGIPPQAAAFVLLSRTGGRLLRGGGNARAGGNGVVGRATPARTSGIPDAR